jgi:hypothetical protein
MAGGAIGGVVGAATYGSLWAQRGGLIGGVLATATVGPEATVSGFYAGRFVGMTLAMYEGYKRGALVAREAGFAVGLVNGIATCP